MARQLKAKIKIEADTKSAQRDLKKLGTSTKQSLDSAEKSAKGLTGGLSSLGAGFGSLLAKGIALAGGFTLLTKGFTSAFKAALDQEDAVKKLDAALAKIGPTAGVVSKALQEQASALQAVTKFGDEEIIAAQSLIAAFVSEEDQLKTLTRLTLDFAEAKGVSLATASDLITKTFASSTNALTRYGIEVVGAAGSTERLVSITGALDKAFQGAAEAGAETFRGKLVSLFNVLGDVGERLAENATQSGNLKNGLGGVTGELAALDAALRQEESGLGDLLIAILFVDEALIRMGGGLEDVSTFAERFAKSMNKAEGAVNGFIGPLEQTEKELAEWLASIDSATGGVRGLIGALTEFEARAIASAQRTDDLNQADRDLTETIEKLGFTTQRQLVKAFEDAESALAILRDGERAGVVSAGQLEVAKRNLAIAEVALRGETLESTRVHLEGIAVTDTFAESVANARQRFLELTESKRLDIEVTRESIRVTEEAAAAQRGAGSSFTQIGGGTFTIPEATVTGANGRVSFVGRGPSGQSITIGGLA